MKKCFVISLGCVLGFLLGATALGTPLSSAPSTSTATTASSAPTSAAVTSSTTSVSTATAATEGQTTSTSSTQLSTSTTSTNQSSTNASTAQPSKSTSSISTSTAQPSSSTSSTQPSTNPPTKKPSTAGSPTTPPPTNATSTSTSSAGTPSAQPSSTNASSTEPSSANTSTQPTSAKPSSTQPSSTNASSTQPPSAKPSSTQPSSTNASSTLPPSTKPSSTSSSTVSSQPPSISTSPTPTTPPPKETAVVINEFTYTGLFKNLTTFFVEVKKLKKEEAVKVVVVVLNGEKDKDNCLAVTSIPSSETWSDEGLKVANISLPKGISLHAVIVALYTDVDWSSCQDITSPATNLEDAVVISQEPDLVTQTNLQTFVPTFASRTLIADPSKFSTGGPYSVSRCLDVVQDPGSFIISSETRGTANSCQVQKISNKVTMMFNNSKCSMFKDEELKVTISGIVDHLVSKLGSECQCGFSPVLIKYDGFDCSTSTLKLSLGATSDTQARLILSLYTAFVNRTKCFPMTANSSLCLTKECKGCGHLPPAKNGNIGVTVGVVIACIAIFIVIIVIVVVYIRKRRRGILQFRMTRLDEDDDDLMIAPDMDDFIGGGQDASFSNPMYTRFKS